MFSGCQLTSTAPIAQHIEEELEPAWLKDGFPLPQFWRLPKELRDVHSFVQNELPICGDMFRFYLDANQMERPTYSSDAIWRRCGPNPYEDYRLFTEDMSTRLELSVIRSGRIVYIKGVAVDGDDYSWQYCREVLSKINAAKLVGKSYDLQEKLLKADVEGTYIPHAPWNEEYNWEKVQEMLYEIGSSPLTPEFRVQRPEFVTKYLKPQTPEEINKVTEQEYSEAIAEEWVEL